MALFTVSYDLNSPGQDYQALYDELERLGANRVLYSDWALRIENTAPQLRDHFQQFLDTNDRLLVVEIGGTWASWNTMVSLNDM